LFGLGLWECLGIIVLAALIFGPRFIGRTFRTLWDSFVGFGKSFQQAAGGDTALPAEEQKALTASRDQVGASHS